MNRQSTLKFAVLIALLFFGSVISIRYKILNEKPLALFSPLVIPLQATLTIEPSSVPISVITSNATELRLAQLTLRLRNNLTETPMTAVTIVFPSTGLDFLETVSARRYTNTSWKSSDTLFRTVSIAPQTTRVATVSAFSSTPGTFSIRAWIVTTEGIVTTTNQPSLTIYK